MIQDGTVQRPQTKADYHLEDFFDEVDQAADDPAVIKARFIDKAYEVSRVKFVADAPGKNATTSLRGGSLTARELERFLESPQRGLVMQTPYLVFGKHFIKKISRFRKKQPHVDILISTNSLAATDNLYAYSFAHKLRKQYLKTLKFRLFEFKPMPKSIMKLMPGYSVQKGKWDRLSKESPDNLKVVRENNFALPDVHMCIHAKTYVVDEERVWIGSFNIDPRSAHLNTEVGLMIWDEAVAKAVRDNIMLDIHPQNSWTVGYADKRAIRSYFIRLLGGLMSLTQLIKFWPFRYTHNYALKSGGAIVSCYDPEFREHYYSVGAFPQVQESTREVEVGLLKAFGRWLEPIV